MKNLILGAIAATLVAAPIAATPADAQVRHSTVVREHANGRTTVTRRTVVRTPRYRTWRVGQRFDRRYAEHYGTIGNYRGYRLNAPGRGEHWVRSGRDALLIRGNGTIVRIIAHRF